MDDLQKILDEVIVLQANTRQVHWNATGRGFIALHKYLDDVYGFLTEYADDLAERMRALRQWPDGTVDREITTDHPLEGGVPIDYKNVIAFMVPSLEGLSNQMTELAKKLDDDLATQDLLIEGIREVDKIAWLLRMERFS